MICKGNLWNFRININSTNEDEKYTRKVTNGDGLMNKRITFIGGFNSSSLEKIEQYTKEINDKLCRVPFGRNIANREEADTLPFHFTLSSWDISCEDKVINDLSKIEYPKLKIHINDIKIMSGKENSYVLYFDIEKSKELKILQSKIYQTLPSEKYNPENFNFHITIHIDKDYTKINLMKEKLLKIFTPFELEIDAFNLYEIWPGKLVKSFKISR